MKLKGNLNWDEEVFEDGGILYVCEILMKLWDVL